MAVLLAWACLSGGPRPAGAAEPLQWKFRAGETLRYSLEQKMVMTTKSAGIERKSNRTHTLDFAWTVLSVAPSGEAEIRHKTERIRLKAEEPPYMPFDFDSAAAKADPTGFEAMAKVLRAEAGAEFTFRMKPTGEIVDIKVPEPTLRRYRDAAPTGAPGTEISEKAIKDNLMESSPPSFPADPLDPGRSWTARPARVPLQQPPIAVLILDRTFTYQGPDPRSPQLRLIGVESSAKVEPIPGADVKVAIRKQEGHGNMTLDAQAGHVVSTRLGLKIELVVTAGQGQTIEQTSESSSSMTLQP